MIGYPPVRVDIERRPLAIQRIQTDFRISRFPQELEKKRLLEYESESRTRQNTMRASAPKPRWVERQGVPVDLKCQVVCRRCPFRFGGVLWMA